mgnify:CR=1 FL=1
MLYDHHSDREFGGKINTTLYGWGAATFKTDMRAGFENQYNLDEFVYIRRVFLFVDF